MFLSLLITYKYWFIFLGSLVGGELFMVPVIYFVSIGSLDVVYTLLAIAGASFVSDTFWYFIGKYLPLEKIGSLPLLRSSQGLKNWVENLFENDGFLAVFLSKFMYGTRTISQILSGVYRLNYFKYILSGLSGVISLFLTLYLLAHFLNLSISSLKDTATSIQVSFSVFILIMILFHVGVRWFFKKKTE